MDLMGLKSRCWQNWILSEAPGKQPFPLFWFGEAACVCWLLAPYPVFRVHHTSLPPPGSFWSPPSGLPLRRTPVMACEPVQIIQDNLKIRNLIVPATSFFPLR